MKKKEKEKRLMVFHTVVWSIIKCHKINNKKTKVQGSIQYFMIYFGSIYQGYNWMMILFNRKVKTLNSKNIFT